MLSNHLRNARISKGFTQEYIAKKLYVSRQTISRWEQGKTLPNIHVIKELSEVYDLSVDDLISGTVFENIEKEDIKMKKINYLALFGSLFFNVFLFSGIIVLGLAVLCCFWVIPTIFVLSPFVVLVFVQLGLDTFSWLELSLGIGLAIIGIVLLPLAKKITIYLLKYFKNYLKFNYKSIFY